MRTKLTKAEKNLITELIGKNTPYKFEIQSKREYDVNLEYKSDGMIKKLNEFKP